MNPTALKAWLGQSTTGQGFAVLLTTAAAVLTNTMSWQTGLVTAVSSLVLIIWPQNAALAKQAGTLTSDVESILPLLLGAFQHGMNTGTAAAAVVPAPVPPAPPAPQPIAPVVIAPAPAPAAPALPPNPALTGA